MTIINKNKKMLQFGAGNIGRGLIGPMFSEHFAKIIFADIDKTMVEEINNTAEYTVSYYKTDKLKTIRNISALNSSLNQDKINTLFEEIELIGVSVGTSALKFIAKNISEGVRHLYEKKVSNKISVIAFENTYRGTSKLKKLIEKNLKQNEKEFLNQNFLFFDSAIDGVIPDQSSSDNLSLVSENYYEIIVEDSKNQFLDYENIIKVMDIEPYINRKLYIVNMGHALIAWAGFFKGYSTIEESISDPDIYKLFQGAIEESTQVLVNKYPDNSNEIREYAEKIIERFSLHVMPDQIERVGRNPLNKLTKDERFLAPVHMYLEMEDDLPKSLLTACALGLNYANSLEPIDNKVEVIEKYMGLSESSEAGKFIKNKLNELIN